MNIKITVNKKKIASIADLLLLGLNLFWAIQDFREGSWTWGTMFAVFTVLSVVGIYKGWAWKPPKAEEPSDLDKTKELKKGWKDDL